MAVLFQDLRYALRQLRRSPGFTLTVLLTIALGIGAVTAVFSVVHGVLLAPYTFRDPGRVIVWRETVREMQQVDPLLPDNYRHYVNLKEHAQSIEDAAILRTAGFSVSTGVDHPQILEGLAVSPNFFSVLGVTPLLGRSFLTEEAQTGRDKEIILTWGAWQRLFHGDASVLGKTLQVRGKAETVVGVLPESFRYPVMSTMPGEATFGSTERYELFEPLAPPAWALTDNEGDYNFLVVARLRPGVTTQQAQTELDGIEKATAVADHLHTHPGVVVEPFSEEITGGVSKPLWLLLIAVLSVLLLACVNLANLQMARAAARDHETALRSALGAGRGRLMQGALLENLLLGLGGGLGGVLLAAVGMKMFVRLAASLPRMNEVHLNPVMLALALGLSVLTSFGFGILPALRSLRIAPQTALQASVGRASSSRGTMRTRRLLVMVQVAGSVTLLIVTCLVTRSFSHLLNQDRAFNTAHVELAKAALSSPQYADSDGGSVDAGSDSGSHARGRTIDRILERLRSLPGMQSVAVTSELPLSGESNGNLLSRPDHPVPEGQTPIADLRLVSPEYFNTMRISIVAGRSFGVNDRQNPRVVIVSEKAAAAAWPDISPLGRTIKYWDRIYTVVGIAADARINDLKLNTPIFYIPYWDYPPERPVFLVRGERVSGTADVMGSAMRQTIWSVDPEIAIPTVSSLDDQLSDSVATERFQTVILSSFGGAALLLSLLGIYGVLAYTVSLRIQEFGIRVALGSSKARLARLVLLDAAYPVLGGIAVGLIGAVGAARWVRSVLYETSAADPLAIGLSIAALIATALAAALIPARNAASVDPIRALRGD
jgi:predicted permease